MSLSDAQKKLRAGRYGSSEVASIVGVGPGSAIDVYQSKIGGEREDDENLLMELGSLLEEPVASVVARRTGTFLARCDSMINPRYPLAICTPDRASFGTEAAMLAVATNGPISSIEALQGAQKLIEIKTTGRGHRKTFGPEGSGQVPEEKALQATWQLGLTGLSICDMPVLFRGDFSVTLETFVIAFNADLFAWLYDSVCRFDRDFVQPRRPPPPDGSDAYDEALKRMFPADQGPPVVADQDDERLMLDYARFREVVKRAEALKKQVAQTLKNRIGMSSGIVSPGIGKVSWTRSRDGSEVEWQMAATDAMELCGLVLDGLKSLRANGAIPTAESLAELERRLKAILPDATRVKSGYRTLRFTPKKGSEADIEMAKLNVVLDALGDGT